jgi:cytochrome P450
MTKSHWLYGYQREFAAAPHRFPAEMAWKAGGLAKFRILHVRLAAIANPDYAWHVLVGQHEKYQRSFQFRNHQLILGKGLLSTDGEGWLKRRRQALPAFKPESLRRIVPATCAATEDLFSRWDTAQRADEPVLIVAEMQRLAMNVIGRTLLSTDLTGEEATRFGGAVRESLWLIRKRNTSLINAPMVIPTRANRRLIENKKTLDVFVQKHLASHQTNADQSRDMVGALMKEGLTAQALLDETKTLFLAGFETTAAAMTWCLYLLAKQPDVAERCHAEIESVLGGRTPTWEDLEKLKWTQNIVNETLRLYPPVYTMPRECLVDDEIGSHAIQRGMLAVISIYGIHHSPDCWPEPYAFRPERFESGEAEASRAFLPFGVGKHTCIGNTFAMVEMKLILAMILQRYRLKLADQNPVGEKAQITLVPEREIGIRLETRFRS